MDDEIRTSEGVITDEEFLAHQFINVSEVNWNVDQKLIITTEDKAHLCLLKHSKQLEKRRSWIAPAGIFIAIFLTLVTSRFRDFLLSAAEWQAIFKLLGFVTFLWLLWSLRQFLLSKSKGLEGIVRDILDELKRGSQVPSGEIKSFEAKSEAEPAREGVSFEIIKATYGTAERSRDVTEELKKLVGSDNILSTAASNNIAGDPHPGAIKTLEIEYVHNDKILTKKFNENEYVDLP